MSIVFLKNRVFLLIIFPAIVILFSLGYYYSLGKYVKTENAYIKAPIITLQSEVSGKVRNVFIKNNQFVKKNEKLIEIDTESLNIEFIKQKEILNTIVEEINNRKAKFLELEEEIKLYQNNLKFRENEIIRVKKLIQNQINLAKNKINYYKNENKRVKNLHKNQILLAEEKLDFLKKEYLRNKLLVKNRVGLLTKLDSSKHLYESAKHDLASLKLKKDLDEIKFLYDNAEKNLVSVKLRKDLDETRYLYESAVQKLKLTQKKKETILTKLMGKKDLDVTEHPLYQKNLAILNQIRLNLKKSIILADESGFIGQMNLENGEYIKQGQKLFVIIEQSKIYLEANLKETQMTNIEVGQKATFIPDTFPDLKWNAIVDSISPATGSEFAILPAQNSSGNWVKVVQRLPVRFKIQDPSEENNLKYSSKKLRLGMTVSVVIDTEFKRQVPIIIKPFSKFFEIF